MAGLECMMAMAIFLLAGSFQAAASGRFLQSSGLKSQGVVMTLLHNEVVLDNGLVQVSFSKPEGFVTRIHYNGITNVLEPSFKEDDRGYWDIVWDRPGGPGEVERIKGTIFRVVRQHPDRIELSFLSTGSAGVPLHVDKRFIMLAGQPGFYCYGIFNRPRESPDLYIDQIRIVFKLWKEKFNYMAISDERQRNMPFQADRSEGKRLDYPEAVRLSKPDGEVDDKYQYSAENRDGRVHGWISESSGTGFWVIKPSDEFQTAGPTKQELTCHVGPTALSMFHSLHYAGEDDRMQFGKAEPWRKVYGPVFIYLNSVPREANPRALWRDAKARMMKETANWPYDFAVSPDFPSARERGTVTGQLQVCDRYGKLPGCRPAANARVGLALRGPPGSWQTESKGYQFWTVADEHGNFMISNVRAGEYGLQGWLPGAMGDYASNATATVAPGSKTNLGLLQFNPPRNGPTLWEIGVPDRTAVEFFIPDPSPQYVNSLYKKHDRFRQYGLWERYTELYPKQDLIYTVGVSDYQRDWFYAQVTRKEAEGGYRGTTWQVVFELPTVSPSQTYVLRLALASATASALEVRVNDQMRGPPHFSTGLIGRDNAIARHGIHGLYAQYSVSIPGAVLRRGRNVIFLTQGRRLNQFQGIMYDYLRLEGPPSRH